MKKLTRSEFACNVTLLSVLACTAIHFLVITLNLFGAIKISLPPVFDYIVAYVLIAACLALYIFGFSITKFKSIMFPAWLRIMFYIAFFLFTNTYYILGLYGKTFGLVIFFAYIAILISILSVSIFYNVQKDEKNRLKSTARFISLSIFCYSIAFATLVQFAVAIIRIAFMKTDALSTLSVYVIEMATMLAVNVVMTIAFWISLQKSKKFINACLVKKTMRVVVKKYVKVEEAPVEVEKVVKKEKKNKKQKAETAESNNEENIEKKSKKQLKAEKKAEKAEAKLAKAKKAEESKEEVKAEEKVEEPAEKTQEAVAEVQNTEEPKADIQETTAEPAEAEKTETEQK